MLCEQRAGLKKKKKMVERLMRERGSEEYALPTAKEECVYV